MQRRNKIVITGGAGLVGQNLAIRLSQAGYHQITVLDKHAHNLDVQRQVQPHLDCRLADLAEQGNWQQVVNRADVVIMLHAQIGSLREQEFLRNNVRATANVLDAMASQRDPYLLHVSSSVIESIAEDAYTKTKKRGEDMVRGSNFDWCILRPTLMFGWFDRKHLGWLARFMRKTPVFPIPGNGRYVRQPLFVGDLCQIILSCLKRRISGQVFDITGLERVAYVDIIRAIRRAVGSRTLLLPLPYPVFHGLLEIYSWFDRDPPFTREHLRALVTNETFAVIDWEAIFGVSSTPFEEAVSEAFAHPQYSKYALKL